MIFRNCCNFLSIFRVLCLLHFSSSGFLSDVKLATATKRDKFASNSFLDQSVHWVTLPIRQTYFEQIKMKFRIFVYFLLVFVEISIASVSKPEMTSSKYLKSKMEREFCLKRTKQRYVAKDLRTTTPVFVRQSVILNASTEFASTRIIVSATMDIFNAQIKRLFVSQFAVSTNIRWTMKTLVWMDDA